MFCRAFCDPTFNSVNNMKPLQQQCLKQKKKAQYYLKALKYTSHRGERKCFLPSRQTLQKAWWRHLINTKELKCLSKWRKNTFMGLCSTIGDYLYAKPRGIQSNYNAGEFWWTSMKLQVPGKWLRYSHGTKVQRHRVAQLLHTWGRHGKFPSSPWDSCVTDSPKISL